METGYRFFRHRYRCVSAASALRREVVTNRVEADYGLILWRGQRHCRNSVVTTCDKFLPLPVTLEFCPVDLISLVRQRQNVGDLDGDRRGQGAVKRRVAPEPGVDPLGGGI